METLHGTENGVTFYYWYDANDELIAKGPNSDGSGVSLWHCPALTDI